MAELPLGLGVGGGGFEPPKAKPPDLQSGPFDRSGTHPLTIAIANIEYLCKTCKLFLLFFFYRGLRL